VNVCTNVPANSYVYFAVDVPASAKYATNILANTGPNALNVIFNQTLLPTGSSQNDYFLLNLAGTGTNTATLSTSSGPPFLQAGQRYFLAVQNPSNAGQDFCLQVNFDGSTNGITITSLDDPPTTNSTITTNVLANTVQYYYYDITNQIAVFQVTNMSADVDMVISHNLPLPDANHFDYGSFKAGTNDDFIVVRTNSSPVPLTPGRWFVTVFNSVTNANVTYTITATQATNDAIADVTGWEPCITTANDQFTSQPGPAYTNFFATSVTTSPSEIEFDLAPSNGNVDLIVRLNDHPTPSQFDFGSFNSGLTAEKLVIVTNSALTNLNGIWYVGVPNNETFPVDFTLCVSFPTGVSQFPAIVTRSAKFTPGANGGFSFDFTSVSGQAYYVDMSTDLVTWTTLVKIVATSDSTSFNDPNPPDTARYYRLRTTP
jgi:hypothetical protein